MIGWLIFGGIVLLIAIILTLSISFEINFENEIDYKIRYAFFSLFPKKAKKTKLKKNKSKTISMNKEVSIKEPNEKPKPESIPTDKISTGATQSKPEKVKKKLDVVLIRSMIDSLHDPLKRLVKKIRINEIYIDSVVGGEDAAKVAMNYGMQNAAVHGLLAWLDSVARITVKEVKIEADFFREESDLFFHCKVKIRVSTLLLCVISFMKKYAANSNNQSKIKSRAPKRV